VDLPRRAGFQGREEVAGGLGQFGDLLEGASRRPLGTSNSNRDPINWWS
jgi:hypothetical protein